jgi:hypothetical protein
MVLSNYTNNPESKFLGPDGNQCGPDTRGVLQRAHVIAGRHWPCGKEMKRKLEQGPVDHNSHVEPQCRVYTNGKVKADKEMMDLIRNVGIKRVVRGTDLDRRTIRRIVRGNSVKEYTHRKLVHFLEKKT